MPNKPTRREMMRASAAGFGAACASGSVLASEATSGLIVRARRPKPPYRTWFAPRLFERDIDLYENMTLDAGGWLDPRLAEHSGKTALNWVYGPNDPDATGPDAWRKACSEEGRAMPRNSKTARFISAGISIDEWVPPKLPNNIRWISEGLRAGRKENPDVFIAIWTTDPTPPLMELGRDGTLDLIIVEGYTHSAAESGPGLVTSWANALRRCDTLSQGGLESKTVLGFGHITAKPDAKGRFLKGQWIRERAEELKKRYPQMPGVAFFQYAAEDSPEFRELIRACDEISGQLWTDAR